ncbi:hypothetical protein [Proteus columbae]|uniref:hypothetical protein n=1 Tax=Proteus columbae TaxID=1987580 RepID=UPI0028896EC2|nr:hypothetical protein [Proteus columbae]
MYYKNYDINLDKLLRIDSSNTENTIYFLNEGVKDISINHFEIPIGYRLVKSLRKDQYRLVTTDKESETVYLVELRFRQDIVYGKTTCTQINVWRSCLFKHYDAKRDFPRSIFHHILNDYPIVITLEDQLGINKRFWDIMISWVFSKNYFIYLSSRIKDVHSLTTINSLDELYEKWENYCWGKERDTHTHRLLVISQEKLSQ